MTKHLLLAKLKGFGQYVIKNYYDVTVGLDLNNGEGYGCGCSYSQQFGTGRGDGKGYNYYAGDGRGRGLDNSCGLRMLLSGNGKLIERKMSFEISSQDDA